jgi:pyruvate dehydrogenase E1 component alpha subunit
VCLGRDPLVIMQKALIGAGFIDEDTFKKMDKECKEQAVAAMKFAEESPWPDPLTLEEDVYAP